MQKIGVFTKPDYHKRHHKYATNPYVFSSFTSSGILHPLFPFFESYFDRLYYRAFEDKNFTPYESVIYTNTALGILNVLVSKPPSDALLKVLLNPSRIKEVAMWSPRSE